MLRSALALMLLVVVSCAPEGKPAAPTPSPTVAATRTPTAAPAPTADPGAFVAGNALAHTRDVEIRPVVVP